MAQAAALKSYSRGECLASCFASLFSESLQPWQARAVPASISAAPVASTHSPWLAAPTHFTLLLQSIPKQTVDKQEGARAYAPAKFTPTL